MVLFVAMLVCNVAAAPVNVAVPRLVVYCWQHVGVVVAGYQSDTLQACGMCCVGFTVGLSAVDLPLCCAEATTAGHRNAISLMA